MTKNNVRNPVRFANMFLSTRGDLITILNMKFQTNAIKFQILTITLM